MSFRPTNMWRTERSRQPKESKTSPPAIWGKEKGRKSFKKTFKREGIQEKDSYQIVEDLSLVVNIKRDEPSAPEGEQPHKDHQHKPNEASLQDL